MEEVKPLVFSKAAQGAIVAAIPTVVTLLETVHAIPPGTAELISKHLTDLVGVSGDIIANAVTLAGVAWSLWGTFSRSKQIGGILS